MSVTCPVVGNNIKGTTYILNDRTANKIGLKIIKTNITQKLILIYNYVNLLISNSIAKRKISFPKLNKIKTFESDLNELIERKIFIREKNNKFLYEESIENAKDIDLRYRLKIKKNIRFASQCYV